MKKSLGVPKIKKISAPRTPRGHVAFGGGSRAFRDPTTMVAPDQAFSAAMSAPQGGAGPAPGPSLPPPPAD